MNRLSEYDIRKEKVSLLPQMGIHPYAWTWNQTHHIGALHTQDKNDTLRTSEEVLTGAKNEVSIAGRLMLKRISGKLSFAQLKDETGTIQLMFEHQQSKLIP